MAAIRFLATFIPEQLRHTPSPLTRSFAGETVIVTGSNTGLGKEAVRQVVDLGASRVIMAVRTTSKGERAKSDIETKTGKKGIIDVWQVDMASCESVKAFAARCSTLPRIDAVIENAGIMTNKFQQVGENESTITINVINTMFLALLLLPILRESASKYNIKPRLTIVSSALFEIAPLKAKSQARILDAMNDEKSADMNNRYQDSKLLELLYLIPLVERQQQAGSDKHVIINAVNPGWCESELERSMEAPAGFKAIKAMVIRTTEEGARCLVYGAGAGLESHGKYVSSGVVRDISGKWPYSKQGKEVANKIFEEVNERLERVCPGITRNI